MRIALVVALASCGGADAPPASTGSANLGSANGSDGAGSDVAYATRSRSVGSDDNTGHGSGVGGDRFGARLQPRAPGPHIKLGQPDIGAGVDPAIVRRHLKRNLMKLQYCYERVLAHKPELAGTVIATFTVGTDGRATKADATGVDPDIASCMVTVINGIEFPHQAQELDVRYPIEVHPI